MSGEETSESIAEYNDEILEKFSKTQILFLKQEIIEALRKATIDMAVVPTTCGSSFKNKGVQFLLDAVMRYLPSPLDIGDVTKSTLILTRRSSSPYIKEPHSAA